jgi:hypothetical protein
MGQAKSWPVSVDFCVRARAGRWSGEWEHTDTTFSCMRDESLVRTLVRTMNTRTLRSLTVMCKDECREGVLTTMSPISSLRFGREMNNMISWKLWELGEERKWSRFPWVTQMAPRGKAG